MSGSRSTGSLDRATRNAARSDISILQLLAAFAKTAATAPLSSLIHETVSTLQGLGADAVCIIVDDGIGRSAVTSQGFPPAYAAAATERRDDGTCMGAGAVLPAAQLAPTVRRALEEAGLRWCRIVPLLRLDRICGEIHLGYATAEPRGPSTEHMVQAVASIFGLAVARETVTTAHKSVLDEQRWRKAFCDTLLDDTDRGVLAMRPDGTVLLLNAEAEAILGVDASVLLGARPSQYPPHLEPLKDLTRRPHGEGALTIVLPDGKRRRLRMQRVSHVGTADRETLVWTFADVTETSNLRTLAKRQRRLYQTLVDSSGLGVLACDSLGGVETVNPAMLQILGMTSADGDSLEHLDAPILQASGISESIRRCLRDRTPFTAETTIVDSSQARHGQNLRLHLTPLVDEDNHLTGAQVIIEDYTPEKRVKRLLRLQRDLGVALAGLSDAGAALRLCVDRVMEAAGLDCGGAFLVSAQGMITAEHCSGCSVPEPIDGSWDESPLGRLLCSDGPRYLDETEVVDLRCSSTSDAPIRHLAFIPVRHENRRIATLVFGSAGDHTFGDQSRRAIEAVGIWLGTAVGRMQAEAERDLSERRFRQVFDNISSGLLVTRPDGTILMANPPARRWLALPEQIADTNLRDCIDKSEAFTDVDREPHQRTLEIRTADGKTRLLGSTSMHLELPSGEAVVTMFRDVAPIKQADDRRRRAEQLAQVGEMAARLGHEIKNPLASIVVGLQLLEQQTYLGSTHNSVLQSIIGEVRRLSGIIDQLLAGARYAPMRPQPIRVGRLLWDAAEPHQEMAATRGVILELRPGPPDAVVTVDRELFQRTLGNLIVNAIEAMSRDGRLELGWRVLSDVELDAVCPGFPGRVAVIDVLDSGPGIPLDHLERVFDPFFTSKKNGTGLGLAIAKETVELHGGVLRYQARSGGGSRFQVLLAEGEQAPCWESANNCPLDCDECFVRLELDGQCCWSLIGQTDRLETAEWAYRCARCLVFQRRCLQPSYYGG